MEWDLNQAAKGAFGVEGLEEGKKLTAGNLQVQSLVEGPKNADLPKVCVMLLHLILAYDLCMPSCAFPAGLVGKNIPVPVYTVKWILLHRPRKRHPNCHISTL